jgi:hypothetical protein
MESEPTTEKDWLPLLAEGQRLKPSEWIGLIQGAKVPCSLPKTKKEG